MTSTPDDIRQATGRRDEGNTEFTELVNSGRAFDLANVLADAYVAEYFAAPADDANVLAILRRAIRDGLVNLSELSVDEQASGSDAIAAKHVAACRDAVSLPVAPVDNANVRAFLVTMIMYGMALEGRAEGKSKEWLDTQIDAVISAGKISASPRRVPWG